jgi:hypothetical protein
VILFSTSPFPFLLPHPQRRQEKVFVVQEEKENECVWRVTSLSDEREKVGDEEWGGVKEEEEEDDEVEEERCDDV